MHLLILLGSGTDSWFLKIFKAELLKGDGELNEKQIKPGDIFTDNKTYLYIGCGDGLLSVLELQLEGKRRMITTEFLRGFDISQVCRVGKK